MEKKELSPEEREELLGALKSRFEKNMERHFIKELDELKMTLLNMAAMTRRAFAVWLRRIFGETEVGLEQERDGAAVLRHAFV